MLRVNLLRIEGKRDAKTAALWHEGRGSTVPWFRYDLAWTSWIRQNFTVEERVNTKLQAVAHELTKMQR